MNPFEIAEVVGTISFALSGFFIASEEKLDILGLVIVSFLTALGGGVIRDVLMQRDLYAFTNNYIPVLVILVVVIALIFKLQRFSRMENSPYFIIADTLGLASFALSGALVGIEADLNFFGVIFLSLIVAVGGGVLRDMLINRVPLVLVSEFYGVIAIFIGVLVFIINELDMLNTITILMIFFMGITLRFIARYNNWHLPKVV